MEPLEAELKVDSKAVADCKQVVGKKEATLAPFKVGKQVTDIEATREVASFIE